ncbi:MAG: ABC transporter permease, partial [Acetobacteraceae bacterium]|nr:ABC transporter permease [Acetobacteraceae bacterium]
NLFNIGVEGLYLFGGFCAAGAGGGAGGRPAAVHLPLTILAGMAGGVLWALLPAYLKVRRGVHEVISTIMMNYIAFSLVHYFIADVFMDPAQASETGFGSPRVRMPLLLPTARMPTLHGLLGALGLHLPKHVYLNWFLIVGVAVAALLFVLIWKLPFGMELRAVAQNPGAAEAQGIKPRRIYFLAFLISGAIAGMAGLSDLLCYFGYMDIDFPRGYGFDGIAVALLAKNDPFAVILAALLFGFLDRGGEGVQALAGVPMEVITILEAVMILSIVVAYELLTRYIRTQRKREAE